MLPELGKRAAILGWSLIPSDKHLLKAIACGRLEEVAVSVRTSKPKLGEKCTEIQKKIQDAFDKTYCKSDIL